MFSKDNERRRDDVGRSIESVGRKVTDNRDRSALVPERGSVTGGFSPSVEFISSIVAGLLLGLGLDWAFGTRPIFTVLFIIAGFVNGFFKLWQSSAVLEEQAEERRRG